LAVEDYELLKKGKKLFIFVINFNASGIGLMAGVVLALLRFFLPFGELAAFLLLLVFLSFS
jgi:hypothetical protein